MELSKKKLQELKDNKISIKDLNDQHFVCFEPLYDEDDNDNYKIKVEVESISKLLNENICSFQEIVDKFKSIEDPDEDPCLYMLLTNKELFQELFENNRLIKEDLRYLLNKENKWYEVDRLSYNINLLKYIANNDLFKELIDKFKCIEESDDASCLWRLLDNRELFHELMQSNRLNTEDLRYLLNVVDRIYELDSLCRNTSLIKHILNEFILNKNDVDRLNKIIENDEECEDRNTYTIFELIEDHNKNNEEILKLNELNEKICMLNNFDLDKEQKLEIHEILRNNEIARNRLIQIIDNHLQDHYDFEKLKNLLTKDSEKKKIKLNF